MRIINLMEDRPGSPDCVWEHGLSFYVETAKHKLLMDFGASDSFLVNSKKLNIDLTKIDVCVLSHGHYDHSGGLLPFSKINSTAAIYLHPLCGGAYYNLSHGYEKYIGIDKDILNLPQCIFTEKDTQIDEELFLFTGITGSKFPCKGNLQLKIKEQEVFHQDTFVHEQCLVITQGEKRILMSGCAHNGIINILDRYYEIFDTYPDIVISGFHMIQKDPYSQDEIETIRTIGSELKKTNALFYTGHCTGETAYAILKEIMGEQLQPIYSGKRIL